ncbi:BolA family protein [Frigidibacter sp. ROC022]|uniref:BolA family protein n=1 Tax=Frigidibacter sp. ROC022 TaxID=2971796 RepID=UPI00215A9A8D|nr:BolA family protein [Frigidibacter sp. ROC022]MCR8725337.1 BolA family transcriptional regulator [Frigidibacter sp. ROC022]
MPMKDQIETLLSDAFAPSRLEVLDESESHRGHAGYQEGGESHFRVRIAAPVFAGMSRLARHRAVHAALGPEVIGKIHALALEIEA